MERTVDTILKSIEEAVAHREIWDAHTWIEAAQSLNALTSNEHDILADLQQKVANVKLGWIEEGKSATEAKLRAEASSDYREMTRQKARIERIEQTIALAKYQARLKDAEMRNG